MGSSQETARRRNVYSRPTDAWATSGSCVPGRTGSAKAASSAAALPPADSASAARVPARFTIGSSKSASAVAGVQVTLNAAAAVLAAFVLRWREPASERPHRALGWPYSGVLFLALAAFMTVLAVRERPVESAAAVVTLVAGGAAYAAWRRRR